MTEETNANAWNGETITVQGSGIHYMMRTKDSVYHSAAQYLPGVGLLKAMELPQLHTRVDSDDLGLHTLIIRDAPEGKMFACLNCKLHYASAEDFNIAHNIGMKQEPLDDELEYIHEPLWEVMTAEKVDKEKVVEAAKEEYVISEDNESNEGHDAYYCVQCNVAFSDLAQAELHTCGVIEEIPVEIINKKTEQPEENFTCEICNISFSAKRYLLGHRKIHTERPMRSIEHALPAKMKQNYPQSDQFYCEICDKRFDSNLLLVHKNMHLSNEASQHTCGICNRDFYTAETYEMHLKVHEGQQLHKHAQAEQSDLMKSAGRFKCQFCDKYFKRPYEKISHERVHTGEKPYACEVCGKRFRVSYSLTMHLRTHTNVRPYVCEVCQKCFKSQPVFAHHKRIHSSERTFQCETCDKTFQTSVQLAAHINSHKKPFVCSICQRAFAALYLLRTHMQAHQTEADNGLTEPSLGLFRCEICGASYVHNNSLRQHMKKMHGITESATHGLLLENLNVPEELEHMDLMSTHFLSETEEIVKEAMCIDDDITSEPVDEQSALLIEVANAAERFEQEHSQGLY